MQGLWEPPGAPGKRAPGPSTGPGGRCSLAAEATHAEAVGPRSVTDHVTISLGGASLVPRAGQPAADLLAACDAALYEAKRGGRNRAVVAPSPRG